MFPCSTEVERKPRKESPLQLSQRRNLSPKHSQLVRPGGSRRIPLWSVIIIWGSIKAYQVFSESFFLRPVTWLRQKIKILQNTCNSKRGDIYIEWCCVGLLTRRRTESEILKLPTPHSLYFSSSSWVWRYYCLIFKQQFLFKNTSNLLLTGVTALLQKSPKRNKKQNWLSPVSIRSSVFRHIKNSECVCPNFSLLFICF